MNLEAKISEKSNASTSIEMSTQDFRVWRDLIQKRSGMYFPDNRQRYLHQCLRRRIRFLKMKSYNDYYHYVAYSSAGESEWKELLEHLIILETSFFRHLPSFDALRRQVLPQLVADKLSRGVNNISFWSAGCSTGQEAYSLAMVLREYSAQNLSKSDPHKSINSNSDETSHSPFDRDTLQSPRSVKKRSWQIRVTGSDISRRGIKVAQQGRYKPHELGFIPDQYLDKYLTRNKSQAGDSFKIVDQIKSLVKFNYIDLNDLSNFWITPQDVIFCQNVLIYFAPQRRNEIISNLCQHLNSGGYLFLAPTEAVGLELPEVKRVKCGEALVYRRSE